MKKLYFYFLAIILFSVLVYGISEESVLEAKVTVNSVPGELNVSPEYLFIHAPPLSFVEKILTFQQVGNVNLNVSLYLEVSEISNWISFSENEFIVEPLGKKEIKIFIIIPEIEPGTFGQVDVDAGYVRIRNRLDEKRVTPEIGILLVDQ